MGGRNTGRLGAVKPVMRPCRHRVFRNRPMHGAIDVLQHTDVCWGMSGEVCGVVAGVATILATPPFTDARKAEPIVVAPSRHPSVSAAIHAAVSGSAPETGRCRMIGVS